VSGRPTKALQRLLRFLASTEGNTSARVVRGTVWVFMMNLALHGIQLARSVILARLLAPEDFGVMGLVALSTAILAILSQTGTWAALIQRADVGPDVLDTAWLIQAGRGVLLTVTIMVLANPTAGFFDSPALAPVLRVMALTFGISGMNSIGLVLLEKQMQYQVLTYYSLAVAVVGFAVSAAAAVLWRNVWALVAGEVGSCVAALLLSYVVHGYRPRLIFNRDKARELWAFGRYINANGVVTYLCTQGDDAYVGKVLGTEALGFYGVAYHVSNLPATSISDLVSRVSLPAYASVKDDLPQLRQLYLNALRVTAVLSFAATALLFALAPYWVSVLYGSRWLPLVPSFMVLCLYGLERAIGSVAGHVFIVMGNPRLPFQLNLLKLAAMAIAIVPLTGPLGILGTSIAVTISAIVVQSAVLPNVAKELQMPVVEVLRPMALPALGAALTLAAVFGLRAVAPLPVNPVSLVALAVVGTLVYATVVLPGQRDLLQTARVGPSGGITV
jgi:lipopolysaccharide exporter